MEDAAEIYSINSFPLKHIKTPQYRRIITSASSRNKRQRDVGCPHSGGVNKSTVPSGQRGLQLRGQQVS